MITVFHYESPLLEGEKNPSLNVQNLVPEIHCVLETVIIGHCSPPGLASNASSSLEKKC